MFLLVMFQKVLVYAESETRITLNEY